MDALLTRIAVALLAAGLVSAVVLGGQAAGEAPADALRRSVPAPDPGPSRPDRGARTEGETSIAPEPVPFPPDSGSRYRVRSGDTLHGIARLHGVSVEDLSRLNGAVDPRSLQPGDRLRVPLPPAPAKAPALPAGATALVPRFDEAAAAAGVPSDLLMAVAWQESRWRPDARSHRGAVGIGQVLPSTARWLEGTPVDLRDPARNLHVSARFLRWLLDRNGGDHAAALAAYHQGRAALRADGWYPSSRDYVRRVLALRPAFTPIAATP